MSSTSAATASVSCASGAGKGKTDSRRRSGLIWTALAAIVVGVVLLFVRDSSRAYWLSIVLISGGVGTLFLTFRHIG